MTINVDVETHVPKGSKVVVNGREMSLHRWIYSVEARLAAHGLTLGAMDDVIVSEAHERLRP